MARVIKSGWRASGIYPWNPRKGLKSSQVKNKALTEASSFEQPKINKLEVLATLRKSRDMYDIVQGLRIERTPDRKTWALLQKVARRFEQLTANVAYKEAQIYSLQS
jgi:hypothetical protein